MEREPSSRVGKTKTFRLMILTLVLIFGFPTMTPGFKQLTQLEAATKVQISQSKATLVKGKTTALSVSGTTKKIKWTSSNTSVATVSSSGKVKAKGKGTAKITATVSKKSYTCTVTVVKAGEYNTAIAKQNVTYTVTEVTNGAVVEVVNKSGFAVYLNARCNFVDASGAVAYEGTDTNPYLENGKSCILFFENRYLKTYETVKVDLGIAKPSKSVGMVSSINRTSERGNLGVLAHVTNSGKSTAAYTRISVVYYKNGQIVWAAYDYVNHLKAHKTGDVYFEDRTGIDFDTYKLLVDYSYR